MGDSTAGVTRRMSRRRLLRTGAGGGVALAVASLVAACQSPPAGTSVASSPAAPVARPPRQLTLSWWTDIGFPSPFAFIPLGPSGVVRTSLLFDTLTWKDANGIMLRHILPATVPVATAKFVLTVQSAIIIAASLAFLGLGDPLAISWGASSIAVCGTG